MSDASNLHTSRTLRRAPARPLMVDGPAGRGYPRPQLRRHSWHSLDGAWDFALDPDARHRTPGAVSFDRTITVPFAPETPRSGVAETGLYTACWYRRTFDAPPMSPGERLILHFGAVDCDATVWVNGHRAAGHSGGYTPFDTDITDLLAGSGPNTVVVRACDDPLDMEKPRGKQDWQERPHSIWYPRTTGIWQSVWLEVVPPTRIASLCWSPDLDRREIGLTAEVAGPWRDDLCLRITLTANDSVVADDTYGLTGPQLARRIAFPDPGIGDERDALLWSPWRPTLLDAEVRLETAAGDLVDHVLSYTALRSVGTRDGRFLLNGHPYRLRLLLDQGYWPDTGMTPPDDAAVRRDVELVRAMGFNGVRKHQKIEDPRYLYWADRLGVLVWEEMPAAYAFTPRAVERLTREWTAAVMRDRGHPCVVAWVPFNESWGVPDVASSEQQRDYVRALYHLTRALDPTRPVIGNDGWESVAADIIGIHDYDSDPVRLAARYAAPPAAIVASARPAGRGILVPGQRYDGQPLMLTEFGGIALSSDTGATWGYARASDSADLARRYAELIAAVRSVDAVAGFCYTQFADTYQETNGLLYADRTPKFPLEEMARATRGR